MIGYKATNRKYHCYKCRFSSPQVHTSRPFARGLFHSIHSYVLSIPAGLQFNILESTSSHLHDSITSIPQQPAGLIHSDNFQENCTERLRSLSGHDLGSLLSHSNWRDVKVGMDGCKYLFHHQKYKTGLSQTSCFVRTYALQGSAKRRGPRLREFCRQGMSEVISCHRNKVHLGPVF